ncbi:MAG: stage II sporulation protein M, partial [Stackebrandtia sp.]
VRSRIPDALLVARLSRLVLMARSAITGTRAMGLRMFVRFFTHMFPAACYRARYWWAASGLAFILINAGIIAYVANHPEVQAQLYSPQAIDQLVNRDFEQYYSEYQNQNFALKVWTNNARLAGMALVGGALIIPTLWVFWQNALNTGITGGIMVGNGRGDLFFALIAPHGLLEMSAFILAFAVGLRIGWSWISPAPGRTRGQSLAEAGRAGIVVALGLVAVLAIAGLIEGFVTPNLPSFAAIPIGVLAFMAFVAYVVMRGRAAAAEGYTGDLEADLREANATQAQAPAEGRA